MNIIQRRTYLPQLWHSLAWVLIAFFLFMNVYIFFLISIFIYLALCFLFRRSYFSFEEDAGIKKGILFAPISGNVSSITKNKDHTFFGTNLTEIKLNLPAWKEYGISLPFTSEVQDILFQKGSQWVRFAGKLPDQDRKMLPGVGLQLRGVEGEEVGLHFLKCHSGFLPEMNLMAGDRGKRQANIGHFPFGGVVLMYLPSEFDVLVKSGDELEGGQTLIAGLPQG